MSDNDKTRFDRESLSNELLRTYIQEQEVHKSFDDAEPSIKLKILVPIVVIVASIAAAGAWYTGQFPRMLSAQKDVELVMADHSPVRVRPKDPGGMHIANRDKMVYKQIAQQREKYKKRNIPKVTHIMPKPEEPIERYAITGRNIEQQVHNMTKAMVDDAKEVDEVAKELELASQDTPDQKESFLVEENVPQETEVKEPVIELKQEAVVTDKEAKTLQPKKEKKISMDDINPVPVPIRKHHKIAKPKAKGLGQYNLQLGSFRSESDVHKQWVIIAKKHDDLLGDKEHISQRADLGQRGIFYRLKVGPFASAKQARDVCSQLSSRKQGCLFVRNK